MMMLRKKYAKGDELGITGNSCLIVFEDPHRTAVLHKPFNGEPDKIMPMLEDFARDVAIEASNDTISFRALFSAQSMAAVFIHHYIEAERENWKNAEENEKILRAFPDLYPTDLRREEALSDVSWMGESHVYHVEMNDELVWGISWYKKLESLEHIITRKVDLVEYIPLEVLKKHGFGRSTNPRIKAFLKTMDRRKDMAE